MGAFQQGLGCTWTWRGGSVYVRPGGTRDGEGLSYSGRPGSAPTTPPVSALGPRPLPLGDRRPSKKHAGTRPLKEPPHGKSSGRRTWRRERVPFLCLLLLLLPGAGRAVPLRGQGTAYRGRAQKSGGPTGFGGGTARSTGAKAPARSGEHKLFSLQVQEVSSQVLTHNNSEQGEECGAGKGMEKGKVGAVVVLRNQRPRDAWPRAGPAPGLGGRR